MSEQDVKILEAQKEEAMRLLNHGYCRNLHLMSLLDIYNRHIDPVYHHADIYERQQHVIRECYRLLEEHNAEQAELEKQESKKK